MTRRVRSLLRCTFRISMKDRADGATLLEYAVLLALVVIGLLATAGSLGNKVGEIFAMTANAIG